MKKTRLGEKYLQKNSSDEGLLSKIDKEILKLKNKRTWDFLGGPVVKTSPSNAGGASSIPGQGTKIPHASQPKTQKNH